MCSEVQRKIKAGLQLLSVARNHNVTVRSVPEFYSSPFNCVLRDFTTRCQRLFISLHPLFNVSGSRNVRAAAYSRTLMFYRLAHVQ